MTDKRLIEGAFLVGQAALDRVHGKEVRDRHIAISYVLRARRALAASSAARDWLWPTGQSAGRVQTARVGMV